MTERSASPRPTEAQIAAADPGVSAWVGANAGSGKTRVLTQRVARLLLDGAKPERILCLTYTKAAAAEMQNRLFDLLGGWAMAPDEQLGSQLETILGSDDAIADAGLLAKARRLFARALETPGGLKIQTIHAFCDALLRRFPLEAGVSPRFEVLDDRQSALMLRTIRAEMAAAAEAGSSDAFDRIAERLNEGAVDDLIAAALSARAAFTGADIEERLAAHFGDLAIKGAEATASERLASLDRDDLAVFTEWMTEGTTTDQGHAATLASAIGHWGTDPVATCRSIASVFTTQKGEARSPERFPAKAVKESHPQAADFAARFTNWSLSLLAGLNAAEAASRARDLAVFEGDLLTRYGNAKAARALLDFDDLVSRAAALLTRSDMAAWALYRLDKGIDHILVDEAQDTAPGQWAVIRAIAQEFYAGASARDADRTLFVVGDEKQSIYSFQGAEPAAFGENRDFFQDWLKRMDKPLARPDLITSFRSAPGILDFVDHVFAGNDATGLTVDGGPIAHRAHRKTDAARIDLWPLVENDPEADRPPWWTPVDMAAPGNAKARLAALLAGEIKRMTEEDRLPPRDGRPGRCVRPGDILVLVQRRDALAQTLIRELKSRDLAAAGADRLTLAGELAVKDLMALVKVATTPADDLSLAALLRSPLCAVTEEMLFDLAHDRQGTLWQSVTAPDTPVPEVAAMLCDMAGQADYLRPYEFLERALIAHDGRRRLLARLGNEAEDPIDELLVQALAYESRETPTLAGFTAWIEAGDIQVKREMEQGAGEVRVMTVHGAKGLEAPVVILPDTMAASGRGNRPALFRASADASAPPLMLWPQAKALDDPVTAAARAGADAREVAERKRLLYVALTRTEDWLILCGAGAPKDAGTRWYGALERGMDRMGGDQPAPGPEGLGDIRRIDHLPVPVTGAPQTEPTTIIAMRPARAIWLTPAQREARPARASPSSLFPHEEAGGAGAGRAAALAHGNAVHALLERLPEADRADRPALAARLLAKEFPALGAVAATAATDEALRVLSAPFAAEVFGAGTLAEASIGLDLPQISPALRLGRIDRLLIGSTRILVVDFKTDASPPAESKGIPKPYLAQLACYRTALAAIYPERLVETAILWTALPTLMAVDNSQLATSLVEFAPNAP